MPRVTSDVDQRTILGIANGGLGAEIEQGSGRVVFVVDRRIGERRPPGLPPMLRRERRGQIATARSIDRGRIAIEDSANAVRQVERNRIEHVDPVSYTH